MENVTIYKFEIYTGSEESGTLKRIHSKIVGLAKDVDLKAFARTLCDHYKGDEVACTTLYKSVEVYTEMN